ncbi:hypothetical protein C2G38_2223570 [Gigaspora rosea]|uniref:Uncharacterized protein n=1 Tax=Gigaspora rosea TaxID=44941 RepID=A0A397U1B6_9GLOM|nr:hypothetical protein C2G38_2223570 [Gigaspora rosea]
MTVSNYLHLSTCILMTFEFQNVTTLLELSGTTRFKEFFTKSMKYFFVEELRLVIFALLKKYPERMTEEIYEILAQELAKKPVPQDPIRDPDPIRIRCFGSNRILDFKIRRIQRFRSEDPFGSVHADWLYFVDSDWLI